MRWRDQMMTVPYRFAIYKAVRPYGFMLEKTTD
jgi:hypothetical protein